MFSSNIVFRKLSNFILKTFNNNDKHKEGINFQLPLCLIIGSNWQIT